ncbi:PREDICTED: uncharacterized protein LOC106745811 [Dinoponera quadriceps]|uniref:Uncharacterized protein LOC106745811 n=1 Tax=Dinoponera quadriceps TaxID=609295 RepID=A0A6P3XG63_DINQU|nr:PREDICTED: uncharacterized protein LOC106745811 [Dinoponera quadriceps]
MTGTVLDRPSETTKIRRVWWVSYRENMSGELVAASRSVRTAEIPEQRRSGSRIAGERVGGIAARPERRKFPRADGPVSGGQEKRAGGADPPAKRRKFTSPDGQVSGEQTAVQVTGEQERPAGESRYSGGGVSLLIHEEFRHTDVRTRARRYSRIRVWLQKAAGHRHGRLTVTRFGIRRS